MRDMIIWFLKNNVVFWIFFLALLTAVILYMLKKEDIKITVEFSESYGSKIITLP